MGIEAAVLGAAIGAGGSLVGGAMDRRSQGKAVNKTNEVSAARLQAGLTAMQPAYQAGQDVRQQALGMGQQMRQQGMQQGMNTLGQLYGPQAAMTQQGYMDAQKMLLAGLPMQRAALMGGRVDYNAMQPSQTQYDPALIARILGGNQLPTGSVNYAPFPTANAMR